MKRLVGPPSPSSSNDKRNGFARRRFPRTAGPPPAVNARSPRRTEKTRRKKRTRRKIKTARTEETANETEIVTVVAITATRIGKEIVIVIVTVTVNGIGTETTIVEEGSIIDEMIMTTVIGPRGTTGTGITVIGRRSITRTTTGTRGGGTASIGMTTVRRRVAARGNVPPQRSAMRGVKR